jgi:hypothetical protein
MLEKDYRMFDIELGDRDARLQPDILVHKMGIEYLAQSYSF